MSIILVESSRLDVQERARDKRFVTIIKLTLIEESRARASTQEGLGLVVHFPLGCVAKINTP